MADDQPTSDGNPLDALTKAAPVSRRRFLTGSAAVVGGMAFGDGIAKAAGLQRVVPDGAAAVTPTRGGTLTVGSIGSTSDSMDPNLTASNMDLQRLYNFYDTLTYFPHNTTNVAYGLADSIELTKGATVATIHLRPGVTFHNGKSLTADDVIFTFGRLLAPGSAHAKLLASVDPTGMKKIDNQTLQLQLLYPDSIFPERLYADQLSILPVGWTAANPVGTGPFMYKSFVAGVRSDFVRNPNYWISGQPYLDELVIIDLADPTAQINALLSGQVDAIDSVPLNETKLIQARSNLKLLVANGGYFQPIVMRVDTKPFTDVRVRQALKYLVNREQMVTQAYDGWATIGNDMVSPADPAYPQLPQREQDIEQAKSLLKQAGHSDLRLTMVTSNEDFGLIPGAEVFVQNAKAAGVSIKLDVIQPSVYDPKFMVWPFTQDYWGNKPFGVMWANLFAPKGAENETHFNDAPGNKIFQAALKDQNPTTRNEKFRALEEILYNRGGYVVHSFRTTVDAYSANVHGLTPDKATGWSLGQYRYREVWKAS